MHAATPPAHTRLVVAQPRCRHRCLRLVAHASRAAAVDTAPQRPLLAFCGGGIFFFWQVGAVLALQERISLRDCDLVRSRARVCGSRLFCPR